MKLSAILSGQPAQPENFRPNFKSAPKTEQRCPKFHIWLLLASLASLAASPLRGTTQTWRQIPLRYLCVTEGTVKEILPGSLTIADPRTRAVTGFQTPQTAELFFRYLGPTATIVPLESGTVRTQIGLKLRAQDPCNLVYAMWRVAPVSALVVSIKSNPGLHTSSECLNLGYHNVVPEKSIAIHTVKVGEAHSLRAELIGTQLNVYADGQLAWEAELDASAFQFNGPVGFRTDNSQFDAQFFTYQPDTVTLSCPKSGPE